MDQPFLSIIIPAYNEETRLPATLEQAFAFLKQQSYAWEVLVVENGSQDRTLEIAQAFAREHPNFYAIHEQARGKGLAVRRGMLTARGCYRFMADADFSMPPSQINRFLPPLTDADVVIASRELPDSVRYNEPPYRHFVGRVFNALIRWMALPGLHDTQCGFKCFRDEVAEEVFRQQTLTGWSFDVEVLYIARRHGCQIVELPIDWYFNPESKINVKRDSYHMFMDLLKIRLNAVRGVYGPAIRS